MHRRFGGAGWARAGDAGQRYRLRAALPRGVLVCGQAERGTRLYELDRVGHVSGSRFWRMVRVGRLSTLPSGCKGSPALGPGLEICAAFTVTSPGELVCKGSECALPCGVLVNG